MSRAPRYRRQSWHKWLLVVALLAGGWAIYANWPLWHSFSPQDLVNNSELGGRSFNLPVEEIAAPLSGVKAYVLSDRTNPIVSLNFSFRNAGYASDDDQDQGLAQMAAALLTEGAGSYSEQELKEELETRAIRVAFAVGKDDFSGSMLATKANLPKAAEFLRLMLTAPRFEQADVERVRAQMLEALKRQSENPARVLKQEFAKTLYGKHPYARNPLGKAENIERFKAADLRRFVKENLSRNNLLVGLAGDIDSAEAEVLLDEIFAGLPANGRMNFVREPEPQFDGRAQVVRRENGQNMLLAAMRGVGRNHPDFYPLFVADYIWGGAGLTSRLSQEIREKNGLTYGVYSYLDIDDKSPLIMVGFAATADKYAQAKSLLAAETEAFQRKGISAAELDKAKDYLLASYNLRFASIENIAEILTAMQKYNLGLDFLQKRNDYIINLTPEQVNAAARKYFDKDKTVSVELGQF